VRWQGREKELSEILEIRKRAHQFVQAGDLDKALAEYGKLLRG
jgi:hypothetical protein